MQKIYCDCCGHEIEKYYGFILKIRRMDEADLIIDGISTAIKAEICEDCKNKIAEFIKTK